MVLVEAVNDEFGIHIDEDLDQEQIDNIVVAIRKKYKKDPVVLADQKYLWYTEFERYKKIRSPIHCCNVLDNFLLNSSFTILMVWIFTN